MNVLLTGARTAIALELLRALTAEGCRVWLSDCFSRTPAAASRLCAGWAAHPAPRRDPLGFRAAIADLVRRERIALLIPTGEEALWLAAGPAPDCATLLAPLPLLDALHHKQRFLELARAHGPVPRTWAVEGPAHLSALLAREGPLLIKAAYTRFGAGTRLLRAAAPLPARRGGWLAQEPLAGRELCTWSVAHAGQVLAHVAYVPRQRFPLGPAYCFRRLAHAGAERFARGLIGATGFTGLIGFDLIEAPDGRLFPLECNPRATSGAHLFEPGDGLGRALLGRGPAGAPRGECGLHLSMMLLHGLPGALRDPRRLPGWARDLWRGREVLWRRADPGPFLAQPRAGWHLLREALRQGLSPRQVVSEATAWDGP